MANTSNTPEPNRINEEAASMLAAHPDSSQNREAAQLSLSTQSQIDELLGRGIFETYFKNALAGKPTPAATVQALLEHVGKTNNDQLKVQARQGILKHLLPKGIEVTGRHDIVSLVRAFRRVGIVPMSSQDEVKLGLRQKPTDQKREVDVGVDPQAFIGGMEKGAPRGTKTWHGEWLMEL